MKLNKFLQIQLILIIAILLALPHNIRNFAKEFKKFNSQKEKDVVTQYDKKFEKIRKLLPKSGVVGYFTDIKYDNINKGKFFYLTQYALSPTIVLNNRTPHLLVAVVSESFNIGEFCENNNFNLLKNFGNGVMLFSKKAG